MNSGFCSGSHESRNCGMEEELFYCELLPTAAFDIACGSEGYMGDIFGIKLGH